MKPKFYIFVFTYVIVTIISIYNHGACAMEFERNNLNVENKTFRVLMQKKEGKDVDFLLDVFSKVDKKTTKILLSDLKNLVYTPVHVEKIYLYNQKLVIFGDLGNPHLITIVNLTTFSLLDQILCYHPVISPNRRFVIFTKFFPRYTPKEAMNSVILMYDLNKTPEENRLNKKPSSSFFYNCEDVGFPLYPEENFNNKNYDAWVKNLDLRELHGMASSFLWTEDSKKVLFIVNYNKNIVLISLDISQGLDKTKVKKSRIELEKLIKTHPQDKEFDTFLEKANKMFYVRNMKKVGNNKMKIEIMENKMYFSTNTLEIEFP